MLSNAIRDPYGKKPQLKFIGCNWNGREIRLVGMVIPSDLPTVVLEYSATPADLLPEVDRVLRPARFLSLRFPFEQPSGLAAGPAWK